ncbi:M23 family metallopeptidase [Virgisporangium aliadipatigenens]|uniref:M23 family metallopeptidase n=1 Tax=Virgisporangium aliadipatigenens TaxID=741659 RepID=UPI001EF24DDE|nr:M23 family metallopeptidase [Virgisporangium aliadipatigenens]
MAILAGLVLCAGAIGASIGGDLSVLCLPANDPSTASTGPVASSSHGPIGNWSAAQVANAATIVAVGARLGVPSRGRVVAVATAMQESSLTNLSGGDRDSLGLFQQRPSQGWGTPEQILDPEYASQQFYRHLLAVPGWQDMSVNDAAQAVQRSATPNAFGKWEADAVAVVTAVSGGGISDCGDAVGVFGWIAPVKAEIVSGFRTGARPNHQGVDLGAARRTPIRAAAAGVVSRMRCNVPAGHSCDVDGSPTLGGCGWYVDITHPGNVITRYCHMLTRPYVAEGQTVAAGQVIGIVGSSGNSSGPHLHFETHLGSAAAADAVDPVPFMKTRGAPLGP